MRVTETCCVLLLVACGNCPGCVRVLLVFLFLFLFSILPIHYLRPSFSFPPSRNSDPGSHSRLFSPPTPQYGSRLAFLSREDFSSSLVDSRRIVLTHARRSQQLILFSFFFSANKFKISPRRDSNSRTNFSSIRGIQLDHRGDQLWTI